MQRDSPAPIRSRVLEVAAIGMTGPTSAEDLGVQA